MQYCSLQHWILLLSPVTSTTQYCFCFDSIPSFFLKLFLHWSPVAYWAPTDLGSSSFSILSFCPFILFTEKEMATHSSTLAWRIPGTGEPGGLPSTGRQRVGHDWSDLAPAAAASKHSTGQLTSQLYSLLNMNGSSRIRYMETMTMWKRVTKTNRWEMTPEEMDGQFWRKKIIFKTWTQVIKSIRKDFYS